MNKYEGLFIIDPVSEAEDPAQVSNTITEILTKHQAVIGKVDVWGKRQLGYEIKKKKEGIYILVHFELDPTNVVTVNRLFKLNDQIMKSQIVRI